MAGWFWSGWITLWLAGIYTANEIWVLAIPLWIYSVFALVRYFKGVNK